MAGRKTSGKKKSFFDMYDEMVKQAQEEVKSVESDVTVGMKNIRKLEDDINKALGERASLYFDMYDEMVKQAQEEVKSVESDVTVGMKNIRKLEDDINKALGERASLYTKIKEDLDYRQGIADRISEVALSEITLALGDIVDPLVDVDAEIIRTSNEEDSEAGSPEVEAETAVKKGTSNKGNSSKDVDPLDPDSESSSGIEDPQSVVVDDGVPTDSDDVDGSEGDFTGGGEGEVSDSQEDGNLNDGNESEPITDENNESDSGDDANEDVRMEESVNPKRGRRKTSNKNETQGEVESVDENNESDSGDDANEDVRMEESVNPKRGRRKTSNKNETQGEVESVPAEDQDGDAVSGTTGDSVTSDVVIDDLPGDGDEAEIPDDLDGGSDLTEEADLTGGDEPLEGDADVDDLAGSESGDGPTLIGEDTPYSDEEMDFGL